MSVRIDFYILPDAAAQGRLQLACKLAEKAYDNGHSVYLLAVDEPQAVALDTMLWTFKQSSFVPHTRYPPPPGDRSPVWIGTDPAPRLSAEVLINLRPEIPTGLQQFQRVLELVDQQPEVLAASRQRFRDYRTQGLEPISHKL